MRGVLTGQLDPATLVDRRIQSRGRSVRQLPDVPAGMSGRRRHSQADGRGQGRLRRHQRPAARRLVLSRLDLVSRWASCFGPLANWALGNRAGPLAAGKDLGIAQGRKLPRFASRSFMRRAAPAPADATRRAAAAAKCCTSSIPTPTTTTRNWPRPWSPCWSTTASPSTSIPSRCHRAWRMISLGAIDGPATSPPTMSRCWPKPCARATRSSHRTLGRALCLTREYPALLDDDDARLVAENTSEACTYLWQLHLTGKLQLDFKPVNATVGYHHALPSQGAGRRHARRESAAADSGPDVQRIERGCSGMAGTYGLKRENYRNSLRAGWGLISAVRDAGVAGRHHRVQRLQDANGARHDQADDSSAQAAGAGLRPDARGRPP